jgi:hypothetical protein
MKRLGPDLKMPNLKGLKDGKGLRGMEPPAALANVYYDLRDRRLLPLVALVVVAIAAVPFLLGDDPEKRVPVPAGGAGAALEEDASGGATLTVVEASPGLRDYRKRLQGRTPTDPFKQRYVGVPEAAQLESSLSTSASSEGSSSASEENVTAESDPAGSEDSGGGGGSEGSGKPADPGGNGSNNDGIRLLEFRFDIQVSRTELAEDGSQKWSTPQVRRQVPSLTQLPGKKTSVATVGGVNVHNGRVFFLVSDDVKSLDGEFVCKTRTQGGLCELLELEMDVPLQLFSGPNDVRYRIRVLGIDTVPAGKPRARDRSLRAGFGGTAAKFLP